MWPFDNRHLTAGLDAVKADRERIRSERDQFAKDRDAFKYASESASEMFTDTSIVNDCLTRDLTAAREQIAELQAQLTDGAVAEWRVQAKREKKRADRLQKQYDDAVGLNTSRGDVGLYGSEHWKPPVSLDVRPKGAAS